MTILQYCFMMKKKGLGLVLVLLQLVIAAQAQKGVVLDATTHRPVVHANLYSSDRGRVRAVSTDSLGRYDVTFPFRTITVSHISYQRITLSGLPDTIYLTPRDEELAEVEVSSQEPAWIKKKLLYFVKNRKRLCQTSDAQMEYQYEKSNLGDSTAYSFRSSGLMYVPSMAHLDKDSVYQVCPDRNIVYYKDSTAGVDFSDMEPMLYDNTVAGMDKRFVNHHHFCENWQYEGTSKGLVQLSFWSDRYKDDHGFITMDTARCIIIDAQRSTGMKCNLNEKMGPLMQKIFHTAVGLNFTEWTIDQRIKFEEHDGVYRPAAISYKIHEAYNRYDRLASSKKKRREFLFKSREARLTLQPTARGQSSAHYYDISREPGSAIIYIEPKRVALNREAIRLMPHENRRIEDF